MAEGCNVLVTEEHVGKLVELSKKPFSVSNREELLIGELTKIDRMGLFWTRNPEDFTRPLVFEYARLLVSEIPEKLKFRMTCWMCDTPIVHEHESVLQGPEFAHKKCVERYEETRKALKVMQGYLDGDQIEVSIKGLPGSGWVDCPRPCWDWSNFVFRIAGSDEKSED